MPRKIPFEKLGNKYIFETYPVVREKDYYSQVSLPIAIGREIKGKKIKVTIEVIDDE